ncbi:MAG TPA: efflux RND transporter periplasmic adaptor subunit [Candidatus Eisenbacteria bacterium]|jgi:RND family efflux transporter MFP subunit|nr:efflux RND transporter periplasmic adaptor subunit [Candidatus Eisenbacteria bacterium]
MKLSRKTIVLSLIGVAVVALIAFAVASRNKPVTYETERIGRGTVIEEVSVTGSLSPSSKISLEPEVSGRIVKLKVDEGSLVKTGDVMAEIDSRDLQSKIASQRASLDSARARLAELVAGTTPEELALAEAAVVTATTKRDSAIAAKADAETAVANAKANYANVVAKADTLMDAKVDDLVLDYDEAVTDANDAIGRLTGPMFTNDDHLTFTTTNFAAESDATSTRIDAKSKLVELRSAVDGAKAAGTAEAAAGSYAAIVSDLNAIKAHLEADQEVLKYANLSSTTLTTYQQNVSTALSSMDSNLSALSSDKAAIDLQARLNASDITAAQISVSNAQASLTGATFAVTSAENALSQAKADLALKKTGTRSEVIAAQRARVEVEQAALSGLLTELSKRRIVSPIDGTVTEVNIEVGESVQPGKTAIAVQAKGNFEIITNISEIDIGKVKVGDPVRITLDAFPRTETWTGKVSDIHPAEKVLEGVIFYETTVVFDNEDPRLRSGMTANLTIETERVDDVLRVPLRALKELRGKYVVQVLVDGKPVDRDITLGLENTDHAEVKSGLTEGELVVVAEKKP